MLVSVLGPGAGEAAETQVYLSWGSPHGFPGARDTLVRACGDSTRIDTLCLSFEPGEDFPNLVAITGDVEFLPVDGDTLLGYWTFRNQATGPGSCRGEFAGSGRAGCPFPWSSAGMPVVGFLRREGRGLLRLMYAVSVHTPTSVQAGVRYCLARILIQHRAGGPVGDRKSTRLNSSHSRASRMPSSA